MSMTRRTFLGSAAAFGAHRLIQGTAMERPNIVLVYADDLGYGDVGCYGATRVRTPNIDRLARHGVRFTDAHCSAATCTPSRYSLLTGEYAFRAPGARLLPGARVATGDAAALIQPGRVTLPSVLKERGYRTGVVGKWHIGLGNGAIDWNSEIKPGPLEIGFDESFILPATGDRVPCVYVGGHRVANLHPKDPIRVDYTGPFDDQPTGKTHPQLLRLKASQGHDMTIVNGVGRIGYMSGGKSALWNDETMADDLTNRAISFIDRHAKERFFLYFSTHDIHVPRLPHERFRNATKMGSRGNVIAELDWCVGRLTATLEKRGLLKNTLIVFSSDNGAVVDDGYQDESVDRLGGHRPNGPLRGGKYSNFEGGTRIPFIVHWPVRVKPRVSNALVSQLDLVRSFSDLSGAPNLPEGAAPDSENVLSALLGESDTGRQFLVEQASGLSLRDGTWKYISPGKGPKFRAELNLETGIDSVPQLYDLAADLGETKNLAEQHPQRAAQMDEKLRSIRRPN